MSDEADFYLDLLGKDFEFGAQGPNKFDCWSLCREVSQRFGKDLPEFPYPKTTSLNDVAIQVEKASYEFVKLSKPEPFCIVLFMLRKPYVTHCGIVMPDGDTFLHIMPKSKVSRERLSSLTWKHRIKGFYSWKMGGKNN